jgi:chromosome segregation ATPase
MDSIKEAFGKVKQDIKEIKEETKILREGLSETREKLIETCEILKHFSSQMSSFEQDLKELPDKTTSTHKPQNKTPSTHPSTHNDTINALKRQNMPISTGNAGVPTDRQTDRQTHNRHEKTPENGENSIENAAKILDSLDGLKKEIRLKFKRLTDQEVLVFSTIYQLEEEIGEVDYKIVSDRLNLTESSIRDYVGRLIKKGIPVDKTKINNKTINLSISKNLKKVASLSTILQLIEL